jgi:hypothetical protein
MEKQEELTPSLGPSLGGRLHFLSQDLEPFCTLHDSCSETHNIGLQTIAASSAQIRENRTTVATAWKNWTS